MPTARVHMADAYVVLMRFCLNVQEEGLFGSNQQMFKLKREHHAQPSAVVCLDSC